MIWLVSSRLALIMLARYRVRKNKLAAVQIMLSGEQQQLEALRRRRDEVNRTLDELTADLADGQAERKMLAARIGKLRDARDALLPRLEEMRNNEDLLTADIAVKQSELKELSADVQALKAEIDYLTGRRETLRRERSGLAEPEAE